MPIKSKEDRAAYDRAYRAKHAEHKAVYEARWRLENAEHLKQRATRRRLEKRAMCLVAAARVRARKRKIPFDVSAADIAELQSLIDIGVCQVTGARFSLTGPRCATSPSLDRINPALGYVSGNLRVVCHAINAGMGDWGELELLRIVRAWIAKVDGNAINPHQAAEFVAAFMNADVRQEPAA